MAEETQSNRRKRATVRKPDDCVIILFGATGDLVKRKLFPALFHLAEAGLMPARYHIIGCAPEGTGTDRDSFRAYVKSALATFAKRSVTDEAWKSFSPNISFVAMGQSDLSGLVTETQRVESSMHDPVRLVYLAVPPSAFIDTVKLLGSAGLSGSSTRLVIEKPFGNDLESARTLNSALHEFFRESQIFRIDHFLGKEQVQNILAFRFANGLFEAVWNNRYVDYVQIDVPETLTIEGRAGFYEATGAFRDMIVTHLFQILGFLAMEPPSRLEAEELHDRKTDAYSCLLPLDPADVVFGQYQGYLEEPGVSTDSKVETFVALRTELRNERWLGVPWYLRTGKTMAETRCSVTLGFKESPLHMFEIDTALAQTIRPNELTFELSDPGKVSLHFLVKEPGPDDRLEVASLEFAYDKTTLVALELEAYERLFHDVMLGEHLLFNRADAIERLWEIAQPVLDHRPTPATYAQGSWGPDPAEQLVKPYSWHLPDN